MATIYKGECDNQRQPEGSNSCADVKSKTVVIKGKKTTLETMQLSTFAVGNTYESIWKVSSSILTDLPGGMAKLSINVIIKGIDGEEGPGPISNETIWEINWVSIEKPLLMCNNLYGDYAAPPTGTDSNEEQRQTIADEVSAWRDSPQQRKRKYQIPVSSLTREARPNIDADWVDISAEAKKFAQKIAKGVEGYLVFSPVITKTEIYSERPPSGGCGKISTPTVNITGYKYLKNGDRALKQQDKTWTRTESWQGADSWDTDIYETET